MHDEHGNKVNIPGTTSDDERREQREQEQRERKEREDREREQRERDANPPVEPGSPAWPDSDTSGV